MAAAVATHLGLRARLGARAVARVADRVPLEMDDLGRAVGGLEQVERHVAADVAALARCGRVRPRPPPKKSPKKPFAEDVAEGVEDVGDVVEVRRTATFQAGVAEAVVAGPLLADG